MQGLDFEFPVRGFADNLVCMIGWDWMVALLPLSRKLDACEAEFRI